MSGIIAEIGHALLTAAGMAWRTGWSLVLGFAISALLQAIVPSDDLRRLLGKAGMKQIAIATLAGAASSSCSYASASIMRTLVRKGASFVAAFAFLFASTNLVLELGIILILLLGWQFALAEWIGGIVLILIVTLLAKATLPDKLLAEARDRKEAGGHQHGADSAQGNTWRERLADPHVVVAVARNFVMEWRMLWKDLLAGFLIGGAIATFVPAAVWQSMFLSRASLPVQMVADALIGPIVAMLTFVCSIGNVPLAAVLWSGGAGFGGVIAFLFADLIVLPLVDVYRRSFGWGMALYMLGVFYIAIAAAGLFVGIIFGFADWVPARAALPGQLSDFRIDYSFWLNLVGLGVAGWLVIVARQHPMAHDHHHHH